MILKRQERVLAIDGDYVHVSFIVLWGSPATDASVTDHAFTSRSWRLPLGQREDIILPYQEHHQRAQRQDVCDVPLGRTA